jgi:hypothetical protein
MFASHPAVFIPHRETNAFLDPEFAASQWQALLNEARASGRRHLAEKTPRHILHLDLIRRIVPGARFLVMVRDGRDVAASYIRRSGTAKVGRRRWLNENRYVLAAREDPDVTVLRYEDLIATPEASLRRVCGFAGVPFAPEMLRFHETERLWFGVPRLAERDEVGTAEHKVLRNWQINQPLFDGRGKWRELLPADEVAAFALPEPRRMLESFGYS